MNAEPTVAVRKRSPAIRPAGDGAEPSGGDWQATPRPGLLKPLTLALVGAGWLLLAFPPFDLGWLGWLAPVPLFLLALGPWRRPGLWGVLAGFLFFLPHLNWMDGFSRPGWILAALVCGAWIGGATGLGRRLAVGLPPGWRPLALAAAWTAAEWARSLGLLGFTWGDLAVTQHRYPVVLQLLDLTGSFGLTFVMTWVAASLALVPLEAAAARRALFLAGLVVTLSFARGTWLLLASPPNSRELRVGVVQASTSHPTNRPMVDVRSRPQDYYRFTHHAGSVGAELVVWGECAAWNDLPSDHRLQRDLAAIARQYRARLLTGSFADAPGGYRGGTTNSAFLLNSNGRIVDRYDKVALVPMGEYVPWRRWWPREAILATLGRDLTPGTDLRPVRDHDLRIGVAICFESAFGSITREQVRNGAQMLALLTSDAWPDRKNAAGQHEAMAPLRAVETRRSIVRAANAGISSLLDPYGRRMAQIPLFVQDTRVAKLSLREDRTLYVLLGDWPGYLSAVALGVFWLAGRRRRRHARSPRPNGSGG